MTVNSAFDDGIWHNVPDTLEVRVRPPQTIPDADDSLAFHAARLLLLLYFAGDKNRQIDGRTKLAKLDFFVRYPGYLARAAEIKGVRSEIRAGLTPESKMMRYKYGPWDGRYYDIFAYLTAKGFVEIQPSKTKGDSFRLTQKGEVAARLLEGPEFDEVIARCLLVSKLFGKSTGSGIKEFIYRHFASIVNQPLGTEIGNPNAPTT